MQITLLDGRRVDPALIRFDPGSYHFFLNAEDVTNLVTRADKQTLFPAFDPVTDNNRLNSEGKHATVAGSTSVWGNFGSQIINDPLTAPLDSLTSGVKQVFSNTGFQVIAISGIVVVAIILLIKK